MHTAIALRQVINRDFDETLTIQRHPGRREAVCCGHVFGVD